MNCLRFELVKFLDFCFNTVACCKASWHSIFRAVFKDTRQRPRIFVYVNLIISLVALPVFGFKHSGGIKRYTEENYRWTFFAVTVLVSLMGICLVVAFKTRKHILCQIWCINETILILAYFLLTLSESVYIAWPGLSLLVTSTIIKLHGLWVIYYFSLELKYSPERHREVAENTKGNKYFVPPTSRREMKRRETDQTSIASSPPSATNDEFNGDDDCNDSVLDDDSPTGVSFQFFGNHHSVSHRELQYSEILLPGHRHHAISNLLEETPGSSSPIPSSSKDNIIISDLMCGGSSALNMEFER